MALEGIIRAHNDPNKTDPMYNFGYNNIYNQNGGNIYREPNNNNTNNNVHNIKPNGFLGYDGPCQMYSVSGYGNTGNNTRR